MKENVNYSSSRKQNLCCGVNVSAVASNRPTEALASVISLAFDVYST